MPDWPRINAANIASALAPFLRFLSYTHSAIKRSRRQEFSMKLACAVHLLLITFTVALSQAPNPDRQQFIRVEAAAIALNHVRVIDGTGAMPLEDQTILI